MPKPPHSIRCHSCAAWFDRYGRSEKGECRRHAPPRRKDGYHYEIWAETARDDWCMEWLPIATVPPAIQQAPVPEVTQQGRRVDLGD